ncbi:MAG TPA: BON domain-containing protein [Burkholderiales bacterium]|nr:BON domain-containing protein [Burkholderiales bacterium]
MRTHTPAPAVRFARLHFPHQLALVLFLVLLLAVMLGCSRPPQPKTEASTGPSHKTLLAANDKPSGRDAALAEQVKSALPADAAAPGEKIEVDANGGVVILKGRVPSDEVKKRVQDIAQNVPGVKWVQNKLSVAPGSG